MGDCLAAGALNDALEAEKRDKGLLPPRLDLNFSGVSLRVKKNPGTILEADTSATSSFDYTRTPKCAVVPRRARI